MLPIWSESCSSQGLCSHQCRILTFLYKSFFDCLLFGNFFRLRADQDRLSDCPHFSSTLISNWVWLSWKCELKILHVGLLDVFNLCLTVYITFKKPRHPNSKGLELPLIFHPGSDTSVWSWGVTGVWVLQVICIESRYSSYSWDSPSSVCQLHEACQKNTETQTESQGSVRQTGVLSR